ncbi:hypothetical protein F5887DRAFT_159478 [Amanita rubescens]|nr:hypothetical protein F5887DRAFT_159478 [Amanita rubescens]
MTNDIETYCTACHILPMRREATCGLTNLLWELSNLIKYISNVVHHRGVPGADEINDINDTRNGLLLVNQLHLPFGSGMMAFLKTPDFGLTVDDIPYNPPHAAGQEGPASRLTLQHFVDSAQLGRVTPVIAPHNSDARLPQDTREWPPAVIVNLFYAAAAMKAWSSNSFIEYVREHSSDAYYPEGEDEDEDSDGVSDSSGSSHVDVQMGDQTTGQSGSGRYARRSRNRTSNAPPEKRRIADLMDDVYALWTRSSRMGKKKTEDVHASSPSSNEDIKKWLESMENPETNEGLG